jgi:hypothetical protein
MAKKLVKELQTNDYVYVVEQAYQQQDGDLIFNPIIIKCLIDITHNYRESSDIFRKYMFGSFHSGKYKFSHELNTIPFHIITAGTVDPDKKLPIKYWDKYVLSYPEAVALDIDNYNAYMNSTYIKFKNYYIFTNEDDAKEFVEKTIQDDIENIQKNIKFLQEQIDEANRHISILEDKLKNNIMILPHIPIN